MRYLNEVLFNYARRGGTRRYLSVLLSEADKVRTCG